MLSLFTKREKHHLLDNAAKIQGIDLNWMKDNLGWNILALQDYYEHLTHYDYYEIYEDNTKTKPTVLMIPENSDYFYVLTSSSTNVFPMNKTCPVFYVQKNKKDVGNNDMYYLSDQRGPHVLFKKYGEDKFLKPRVDISQNPDKFQRDYKTIIAKIKSDDSNLVPLTLEDVIKCREMNLNVRNSKYVSEAKMIFKKKYKYVKY